MSPPEYSQKYAFSAIVWFCLIYMSAHGAIDRFPYIYSIYALLDNICCSKFPISPYHVRPPWLAHTAYAYICVIAFIGKHNSAEVDSISTVSRCMCCGGPLPERWSAHATYAYMLHHLSENIILARCISSVMLADTNVKCFDIPLPESWSAHTSYMPICYWSANTSIPHRFTASVLSADICVLVSFMVSIFTSIVL